MRKISTLFFLSTTCFATELIPWFTPPFEFQGRTSFFYQRDHRVQTPKGSFQQLSSDYTVQFSLGVTPWPHWNAEVELFFTRTVQTDFSYRAALTTLRYAWLDDIEGDPISLTAGLTLAFPGHRFLHDFRYPYHGDINAEFHAAIGKECARCGEWSTRGWAYYGFGIANRGSPWNRAIVAFEWNRCVELGIFSEGLFGFGNNDIIPDQSFEGYAHIHHQSVDVGSYFRSDFFQIGTFSMICWYNLFARNFVQHSWGVGANLLIPFSF